MQTQQNDANGSANTAKLSKCKGKGKTKPSQTKTCCFPYLYKNIIWFLWKKMAALKMDHYAAVASLLLLTMGSMVSSSRRSDREALLAFRSALQEPYIGIFNSWRDGDCCHSWYGVSCDLTTGRVADINLRGESEDPILWRSSRRFGLMSGRISPAICRLTRLSSIIVADWKNISGEIPSCITRLPFLRVLDLIGNRISGEIPLGIGRLQRLTVLNVADNRISGRIPPSITNLSSLMHLDLRNNIISGTIPRDFGRMKMLSRALLSGNRILGRIPESLTRIYRLVDLDLSMNRIYGSIPETLGKMAVLATLNLDCNRLSGPIPPALLTSSITSLNLSRNYLQGKIPDVFGARSYFTALDLSHNGLRGMIPRSIRTASFVGHLDLSHNHLCGRIPVGEPFDHLEASSFSDNACLCGKPLTAACRRNAGKGD